MFCAMMFEADMAIREMMMFEAHTNSGPMFSDQLCIVISSPLLPALLLFVDIVILIISVLC